MSNFLPLRKIINREKYEQIINGVFSSPNAQCMWK